MLNYIPFPHWNHYETNYYSTTFWALCEWHQQLVACKQFPGASSPARPTKYLRGWENEAGSDHRERGELVRIHFSMSRHHPRSLLTFPRANFVAASMQTIDDTWKTWRHAHKSDMNENSFFYWTLCFDIIVHSLNILDYTIRLYHLDFTILW